eukprot:1346196-Amphidinium_carterae.1
MYAATVKHCLACAPRWPTRRRRNCKHGIKSATYKQRRRCVSQVSLILYADLTQLDMLNKSNHESTARVFSGHVSVRDTVELTAFQL